MIKSHRLLAVALTAALVLLVAFPVPACQPTRTPVPMTDIPLYTEGPEAADDLVMSRVVTYRAKVQETGKENPWTPIEFTEARLESGSDQIDVWYRDHIETTPGTRRHNLFRISGTGEPLSDVTLALYSVGLPSGLEISWDDTGGLPGTMAAVLAIDVPADMTPGEYTFEIGLEIDGKDYGTVPCTVEVVEGG